MTIAHRCRLNVTIFVRDFILLSTSSVSFSFFLILLPLYVTNNRNKTPLDHPQMRSQRHSQKVQFPGRIARLFIFKRATISLKSEISLFSVDGERTGKQLLARSKDHHVMYARHSYRLVAQATGM